MRIAKSVAAIAAVGLLVVACGGAGTPTQNPGNGGTPTQNPGGAGTPTADPVGGGTATRKPAGDGGGEGGTGDTSHGKVHIELSGPISQQADYGYFPAGSVWGTVPGSTFTFTNAAQDAVVSIQVGGEGAITVTWGTPAFSSPGVVCTTTKWGVGVSSASGQFDCPNALVINIATGATSQDGHLTGSFDITN